MRLGALAALLWGLLALPSAALECEAVTYKDQDFRICRVDLTRDDLRLFWADEEGRVYGHFGAIDAALSQTGETLAFGMNAGMYHDDRSPVGLYKDPQGQPQNLITSEGPGNFGLLPNGVFCIQDGQDGRVSVIESRTFKRAQSDCTYATQSGPMLVIDGALHPRFLVDSTSRYVRNGVGVRAEGREAIFAISDAPVTFHQFGSLFRDYLKTPNALYFDGNISRLYAPEIGSYGAGWRMGPVVGVVTSAD